MRLPMFLAAPALFALASPAFAALTVGARAPTFTTQAATGGQVTTFDLREKLRHGPVVVYFFPAAFTSGCTVEAHAFAEAAAQFQAAGATLIGLSADPIATLQRFSTVECRSAFPVGVAQPATISGFDVQLSGHAVSNRTSYVIAPDGRVIYAHSDMNPIGHVEGTLAAVREWRRAHPRG